MEQQDILKYSKSWLLNSQKLNYRELYLKSDVFLSYYRIIKPREQQEILQKKHE
jgi:hypothetical protein